MPAKRHFAIVPAAGQSRRMGPQNKLLLPWDGVTIIDRVLQAWCHSRSTQVFVVVRPGDHELQATCRRWPVRVVTPPHDPVDMKQSVEFALREISACFAPGELDRWLLAPADLPKLRREVIDLVIQASELTERIVLPRSAGRRGHPVSIPWTLRSRLPALAPGQGVNALVEAAQLELVDLPSPASFQDVDTPEDYRRTAFGEGLDSD